MKQSEQIIRELKKGLLQWYPFRLDCTMLYIGEKEDAIAEMLGVRAKMLLAADCEQVCEESFLRHHREEFDYIISVADPEREPFPQRLLQSLRGLLKPDGIMLLCMHNRFGIKYFCGDRDPYTGRSFDGVEGYRRAYSKKEDTFRGRMYSKGEIKKMLESAGWESHRFYSVLTDLENPVLIYAEDYLPNEDLANRVFPAYCHPDSVFLEEEGLYEGLVENGMFHQTANAYLAECSPNGVFCDVSHVTCSLERGRENALFTVIHSSGTVEKIAAYPEGRKRLQELYENGERLRERGIKVVEASFEDGVYRMPFIRQEVGQLYLKKLLLTDSEKFLEAFDRLRDLVLQSSEIVEEDQGDGNGALLRWAYPDMVPLNSFYIDGDFVFYDQEFCRENYPANVVIWRLICTFYAGNVELEKVFPSEKLRERYDLNRKFEKWQKMEWEFMAELRKSEELRVYNEKIRCNPDTVNANRQRMNYSEAEYRRLFVDVFKDAENKKLILFGSGNFAKKFLGMYAKDYPVYAVVDNQKEKWGQTLSGIPIQPPEFLKSLDGDAYKVIICIKNYLSVIRQLEELGVKCYSVFDAGKIYEKKRKALLCGDAMPETGQKKYHVGYVAGVFDMFHVGHVNLLRKAKELCDYLIVGVVSDEGVYRKKKKYPVIPCEDRCEVIRACRYANEVAALPDEYDGIRDAYRMFQFDCQFSGDDHGDNTWWQADREFLKKNGADLVFFPYTEKVSSTKLRERLDV